MKIGINASFIRKPYTGIGQVTANFLRKLAELKTGHDFVLYLEEALPENIKLPDNFEVRIFLPPWKRDDLIRKVWWEKFLLPRKAKKDYCDTFISLYQCPTVLPRKIKHLMVVHDLIPKLFPEYLSNSRKKKYQKMTEAAIRKADRLIAVSKKTEKDIIRHLGVSGNKIAMIHVDVDEIYKKEVAPENRKRVLEKYSLKPGYIYSGGGLETRKNIESAIYAYKFLLETNEKEKFLSEIPQLVISGKLMPELAPLVSDVEKMVRELDLGKQVRILGFVPQEDLPVIYREASFFVYPSIYEGFGLPVLEALNQGTPAVVSKTSSLPEVGGDAVLYCDPEDVRDIAARMRELLLDEEMRRSLSRRSSEQANKFSWESFTGKISEIIKEL